jgi:hypothetical protein
VPDGRSLLLLFAAPSPPALDGPGRARTWGGAQPTARAIRAASSGANVSFSLKRRRLQRRVDNGHPLLGASGGAPAAGERRAEGGEGQDGAGGRELPLHLGAHP